MFFMKRWHLAGQEKHNPTRAYASVDRLRKGRRYRPDELPDQQWAWSDQPFPFKADNYYTVNVVTGEIGHAHKTAKRLCLEYR